jgi:hypothetical protein
MNKHELVEIFDGDAHIFTIEDDQQWICDLESQFADWTPR